MNAKEGTQNISEWVWTVNSDWVSDKRFQFETTYAIHVFAITLIQLLVEQGPIFYSVEYTFLLCVIYELKGKPIQKINDEMFYNTPSIMGLKKLLLSKVEKALAIRSFSIL